MNSGRKGDEKEAQCGSSGWVALYCGRQEATSPVQQEEAGPVVYHPVRYNLSFDRNEAMDGFATE